jgi:hypothetical protein
MSRTGSRIGDDSDGGGGYYNDDDKILIFTIIFYLLRGEAQRKHIDDHTSQFMQAFWTEVNGFNPMAQLDDACTVSFLHCDIRILWSDSCISES